ncbi:MAG: hypothetical protein K2X01_08695 [Cyanobacteria bacterium]|nr:hypothetical protein [Cyanobacteriota bacterium]
MCPYVGFLIAGLILATIVPTCLFFWLLSYHKMLFPPKKRYDIDTSDPRSPHYHP